MPRVTCIFLSSQQGFPSQLGKDMWLEMTGSYDLLVHSQVPSYDGAEVFTKHFLKRRDFHFVANDDNSETVNYLAEAVEDIQTWMNFLMNLSSYFV